MPTLDLVALRSKASGALDGFTRGQKAMLAVALGAALVGALVFLKWAGSPSWAPLYSGLPSEEASSVASELDAMGVAYRLEGGDTILVARDAVYQTRLDLSAKGLPEDGNVGYDLLDDQGITTSEFQQRVGYQRALEGELARTIESIDGVDDAQVHLVLPEDDLFSDDAVRPTASVLVRTKGEGTLSSGQVQAVVHLVAASVEGLQETDVAMADQSGRVLAAPGKDGASAAEGEARAGQSRAFEDGLARSIEGLLVPVTGVGRARVQVAADLDYDARSTTSETFSDPDTAPIVSETTKDETYTGSGQAVGGVLGTETPGDAATTTGDSTDYSRTEAERTYAVDKVTEQVDAAPGAVKRLSVAVLVDKGAKADLADVKALVAAAAGLDEERGDQLEVTAAAFDATALPATLPEGDDGGGSDLVPTLARTGGVLLIVALVLLLAYRSARRSTAVRYPMAIPVEALPSGDPLAPDARVLPDLPELALGPSPEDQQRAQTQTQIGDLIDRQPDEVAQVLRGWLAERRS